MSAFEKLKELAEAVAEQSDNIGEAAWYTADCLQHLLHAGAPDAEFIAAANPAVVLGLIADYESAHKHWESESNNNQVLIAEVVRLTTECERLRKDALRYRHLKLDATKDGCLLERMDCNVSIMFWDAEVDAAMSNASGQ